MLQLRTKLHVDTASDFTFLGGFRPDMFLRGAPLLEFYRESAHRQYPCPLRASAARVTEISRSSPASGSNNTWIAQLRPVADELAAAAGLLMGQGNESQPVVVVKGFNKSSYDINNAFDLIVDKDDDLYR